MTLVGAIPLTFLIALYVVPILSVAAIGVRAEGVSAVAAQMTSAATLRVLGFTTAQALLSTFATALVAAPLTWALARYRFRGRDVMRASVLVPFVMPTVVVGLVFLSILGPRGWTGWDLSGTLGGLIAAHVFLNIAVFVRMLSPRLRGGRRDLEEAAAVLGASHARVFAHVVWPGIRSSVVAASLITFMFCFTTLGIVQVMGAGRLRTLELLVFRATLFDLDLSRAAALAILQLLVLGALVLVLMSVEGRMAPPAGDDPGRPARGAAQRMILASAIGVYAVWLVVPLASLLWVAWQVGAGSDITGWHVLFGSSGTTADVDALAATVRSLRAAAMASAVALPIGCLAAAALAFGRRSRTLRALVVLPLGTSAVTLGLGLMLAYGRPPLVLPGWLIVPLAQALVALPFVVRILSSALSAFDLRLLDAAAVLGASRRQAIREVMLPTLRPAVASAGAFAFVISLGEFGATAFVSNTAEPTLPVAIVRLLSRPGDLNLAAAYAGSVLLIAVVFTIALAADRAGAKEHL